MARLVIDGLWRNRWVHAVTGLFLLPTWLPYIGIGVGFLSISLAALSLFFATMLATFGRAMMAARELRHLPVTRRELSRATWVAATIVPTAILLATKLLCTLLVIVAGGTPKVAVRVMLLSAVYDFAWTNMLLPLTSWFGARGHAVVRGRSAGRDTARMHVRPMDSLSGVARVAVPYVLTMLALAVGACLAMALYGVTTGSSPWWFVPLRKDLFDPADVGDRGLTYVVLIPVAIVTMLSLWTPWARLLKVLPLSVRQINTLLLFTPLATWACLWLVWLTVWSLAYGMPSTLRLDLPIGLAGIAALTHACMLRFQGSTGVIWFVAIIIPNLVSQVLRIGVSETTTAHIVFTIIGAIGFCTAAFVNHRTLTQSTSSSRAYQLPKPPFGIPKPARF